MKKEHRLFIIQAIIALVIFVGLSFTIKKIFLNDPKAQSYLDFNKDVKKMASSAFVLIDSLIANNDLTFDPTSGKSIDKVLSNLKYAENKKFLIIGSSQMRVVQGEDIQKSYQDLVSRKIIKYTDNKYSSYNLSLGGMTTREKLIMADKGVEILNPDKMLISVTPWDCLSDKIRPQIKSIENKTYQTIQKQSVENTNKNNNNASGELFPLNVNTKITNTVDKVIEDNIDIYNNRSAIKNWLNDKTIHTFRAVKQGVQAATEEEFKSNMPNYWQTVNQDLDNITGWDQVNGYQGTKSIKITNAKPKNSKWFGDDITLNNVTDTFIFEGWSKAENVSNATKLYCVDFQVIFEDGTSKWYYKNLIFNKGTHDWEKVNTKVRFDKKVKAIKPHALFYGGTGTVWFDNIKIIPVYKNKPAENIVPNPEFEEELKQRLNVSYSYSDAEWNRIKENMFAVVDHLAKQKTTEQNILLFTPFWHTQQKTTYPQKIKYNNLVEVVKKYCEEKNVAFINASYILSKNNFGVYTKGERKGKIDVLHFDADAHDKLAKYIIKELNL